MDSYGIKRLEEGEGPSSSYKVVKRKLRHTYSHVVDRNVVGLEEDANILVAQLLKEGNYSRRVVSICGMGGLGKTTLARKVYHHEEVREYFHSFVWVCVSQQWQTRDIWEQILFKVIDVDEEKRKESSKKKDNEIAKELFEVLKNKRCLLVLDDMWDGDAWSLLSAGFPPHEDTQTKILLTSRNKDVAFRADPRGFLYEPSCLNDEESWELFQKIAVFGRVLDDADESANRRAATSSNQAFISVKSMEKLGREMVPHCGGLPLAIVVLGGILATKHTIDEWNMVHENIKSHLKTVKGHKEKQLGFFEVLALSYDDLPYYLKPCFLYLGQFPEDFEIRMRRIINLWVAEAIISSGEGEKEETLEDVAYRYLTELTERYLVQVEKRSSGGRIKSFRMHDLMRELCWSKAKETNFFQIVQLCNSNRETDFFSSTMINRPTSAGKIRRVSIYLNNFSGSIPLGSEECPPIRSALGFPIDRYSVVNQDLIESMVERFKFLRVLDLEKVDGFKIPKRIANLIHLRVLTLSSVQEGVLSSSIGNLRFLLALDLSTFTLGKRIPNVIWKMKKLRHLCLPYDCGSKTKKLEFANLKDLQTLINFPADKADVKDLTTLTNLRKLVIQIPERSMLNKFMEIFQPPTTFNHLRSLSIWGVGTVGVKIDDEKILSRCPRLRKVKGGGISFKS